MKKKKNRVGVYYNNFLHVSIYRQPTKCLVLFLNYKDEFAMLPGKDSFNNYIIYNTTVPLNEEIYKRAAETGRRW